MGSLPIGTTKLEAALAEAHSRYAQYHPLSKKSHEEACRYMPGGNTRTVLHTTPFPLTIASGESCYLTTVDNHRLVDFLGEYTAGVYGHNHPVIRDAIQQALDGGWNYGGHNKMEQQLAKIVCERFPAIEQVRFVNSGTEANMMALATALVYTGKKKILLFNSGYHGSTISGHAPSGKPSINLPHDFVFGTYNDVQGTEERVQSLPKDSLAAILVEPMLGSGGCFAATHDFLSSLRRIADERKALLIFDEVMTSRLTYHGRGWKVGIQPDLMTLGKWVGGGMSFGAFGGRKNIMQLYDPRAGTLGHPGTFNNNVFSMTAGVAGCSFLTPEVVDNLNALGESMRGQIEQVFQQHGIHGTVPASPVPDDMHVPGHPSCPPKAFIKGVGSLMCIHFAGPDRELLQGLFFHHMLVSGIYLAQRGFMALNIELKESHVAKFIDALHAFCAEYEGYLKW